MRMDYRLVQEAMARLARSGWRVDILGTADGYPVYAAESPREHRTAGEVRPRLMIDAGIHGEEPAAVVGLLQWLEGPGRGWQEKIDLTVFPCINPWGIVRGIREGPHGRDLNREFDNPAHPYVAWTVRALEGRRFDLVMDMHEDCDFTAMYLYELLGAAPNQGPSLGRRILDLCSSRVDLANDGDVGPVPPRDGLIAVDFPRAERELEGDPIALYLYKRHADHVVTVETPGKLDLDLRASLHVDALDEACRYLAEGASPDAGTRRNS